MEKHRSELGEKNNNSQFDINLTDNKSFALSISLQHKAAPHKVED